MAKYMATRDTWLSHECRVVKDGETFETTFPDGMKLSDNIKLLDEKPKAKKIVSPAVEPASLV